MLQMSAEPKLDSHGGVVGAVCVGEDVLARRRIAEKQMMMEQLERENQLKVHVAKSTPPARPGLGPHAVS